MNIKKHLFTGFFALIFSAAACISFAASSTDKIDADDFVDEVSAGSIAEIENAKLALEKSTSADVRTFAQKMITDHTAVKTELAAIASKKNLKLSTDEQLIAKAKKLALEMRDDSFDKAYAENQVTAHENTIKLFERASISDDAEIAAFAKKTLPTLKEHLTLAKNLHSSTKSH